MVWIDGELASNGQAYERRLYFCSPFASIPLTPKSDQDSVQRHQGAFTAIIESITVSVPRHVLPNINWYSAEYIDVRIQTSVRYSNSLFNTQSNLQQAASAANGP